MIPSSFTVGSGFCSEVIFAVRVVRVPKRNVFAAVHVPAFAE